MEEPANKIRRLNPDVKVPCARCGMYILLHKKGNMVIKSKHTEFVSTILNKDVIEGNTLCVKCCRRTFVLSKNK